MTSHPDYAGTLRARVVAGGEVRADDLVHAHMTVEQRATIVDAHGYVADTYLARGMTVVFEFRRLDGSLAHSREVQP